MLNSQTEITSGNDELPSSFVARGWEFKQRLDAIRGELPAVDFEWYPYDSLGNVVHVAELFAGDEKSLINLIAGASVLDLGCGDGGMAFFLESLGASVLAVDNPTTNHNGMRGVTELKSALHSRVDILPADLEKPFRFPHRRYRTVLLLGLIYHLRNPFHVLDEIARIADYCILSTRITRWLPGGALAANEPIAYLVDKDEVNNDDSNYWIFSEAGLRRLLKRSHWGVERLLLVGNVDDADPIHPERDARAFCLLRTTYGEMGVVLLDGWHQPEGEGWRWTTSEFSIQTPESAAASRVQLTIRFFIPPALASEWQTLQIVSQTAEGSFRAEFSGTGLHQHIVASPVGPLEPAVIRFRLSRYLPGDDKDPRERGIIVDSVEAKYV